MSFCNMSFNFLFNLLIYIMKTMIFREGNLEGNPCRNNKNACYLSVYN